MQFISIFVALLYLSGSVGYFVFMFFQKNYLYSVAQILTGVGFAVHTGSLIYYGIEYSAFPANNLHTVLSVVAWSIVVVFFLIQHIYSLRLLGVYAVPIGAVVMIGSCNAPKELLHDPELFKSVWLGTHVFTVFIGDAALALACGAGVLYIIQENAIKKKKRGFFFNRLPSLEQLDAAGYACVVTGFCFITIGLFVGSVYANSVWGYFWSWDPKEVCSAITWFFYAILLHERLTVGWRGRKLAIMAIFGFAVLLFAFFVVNFLLKGNHGSFTLV